MLLKERAAQKADDQTGPACDRVVCPIDSKCVTGGESGRAHCKSNSSENEKVLETVLGIVLGLPGAICLPCTANWLVFTGIPRLRRWRRERGLSPAQVLALRKRDEEAAEAARAAATSPGKVRGSFTLDIGELKLRPMLGKLGARSAEDTKASAEPVGWLARATRALAAATAALPGLRSDTAADADAGRGKGGRTKKGKAEAGRAGSKEAGAEEDDEMAELFAPTRRGKVEQGADSLDALFGSRRNAAGPKGGGGDEEDQVELDFEDLFAKLPAVGKARAAPSAASRTAGPRAAATEPGPDDGAAEEEPDMDELSAIFHRVTVPRRRTNAPAGGVPAAAAANAPSSGPGGGVSGLFAVRTGEGAASPSRAAGRHADADWGAADPSAASKGQSVGSEEEGWEEEEEEYEGEYDGEAVEAPDFYAFALRIARRRRRQVDDGDEDARSHVSSRHSVESEGAASDTETDVDSLADMPTDSLRDLFHRPLS